MTNNVDALLDLAFEEYNAGDYGAAEQKVQQALMISPTHGDALYLLGLIAYKKGVYTQAIDVLSLLVKTYPDFPNYRLTLAEVYQSYGDLDKAKELYLTEEKNPEAMAEVGWIELKKGNIKEARKIFQKNPSAVSFWGLANLTKGEKKLTYLEKAYEMNPLPVVIRALALYFLEKKNTTKAQVYIKKLPKDKFIQALWFKTQHKESKAIDLLKQLTIENAFSWEAWLELAKAADDINDASLAESAYRRVLDLKKDSLEAAQGLARLLMKESRLPEAIDIYQKLVRENPQNKEVLLAIAVILEGLGETEEALGIYFNLLTLGQKGLSGVIKKLILKLSKTDKETAVRFAEGWEKHFSSSQSKSLLKMLKMFLFVVCFWGCFSWAQMPLADEDLALLWQSKMASFGDPMGQYELGQIYEYGKGIPKDLEKAIYYYQLSAAQKYLPSAMELGRIFANEEVVQDEKKSIEWYTYAANHGEAQAQNYLFHYYDEQNPPDTKKAFYWLEKTLKNAFPGEMNLVKVSADYERLKKQLEEVPQ